MSSELQQRVRPSLPFTRSAHWRRLCRSVIERCDGLTMRTDENLLVEGRELRWRVKSGEPLSNHLVEAFALVRESARRTFGYQHFPVQILGAAAMFEGRIAEMQTGEGKTLTATLTAFLRALPGRGCHIVTVNDYLAKRDAETMGPLFARLGLSTGCILADMEDDARRNAYACDITYGTAKEIGFDFLRDRLKRGSSSSHIERQSMWSLNPTGLESSTSPGGDLPSPTLRRPPEESERPVHRGFYFGLIDEADSILIDDARTPLIIGLELPNSPAVLGLLHWSGAVADCLDPATDLVFRPERRTVEITEHGCRRIVLWPKPALLDRFDTERLYESVEQAATARLAYRCDRDYVVVDDAVQIVDESTGRVMEGRKWEEGLHQAIEAKEGLKVTAATGQAARVAVQTFFREYTHLAGMTGTAVPAARELKRTYGLHVSVIPTHRPCVRRGMPPRIFATLAAKRAAVADEIKCLRAEGRAALVGTPSVVASEALGEALSERGIPHAILNARLDAEEAEIVKQAGQPKRVTIATNMAGRGTDILLHDAVRSAGGLHVIATEMHSSARIDRQLIGRAARQGDPGSYRFFLSLEDELLQMLPSKEADAILAKWRAVRDNELPASALRIFQQAQRQLESTHAKHRRHLLKAERQRREAHRRMGLDPCLELPD